MGVPTSKEALERKNHAALRTLVPRGDGRNPEHRKLVGLKRLDYMIASDWKPEFWVPNSPKGYHTGANGMMESPFAKPRVAKDNIDIASDDSGIRIVRSANV